jgi:hypothetical protein
MPDMSNYHDDMDRDYKYGEYQVPVTREVVKHVVDWNSLIGGTVVVLVIGAALFGIVVGILSANTESLGDKVNENCYYIDVVEKHAFEPDKDTSGVYCREEVE